MIVVRIKGGLGNQLFQYALGYALSQETKQDLFIDPFQTKGMTQRGLSIRYFSTYTKEININRLPLWVVLSKNKYLNKLIRIIGIKDRKHGKWRYFQECDRKYHPELKKLEVDNLYLDGYFQTAKYFDKYRNELLAQFRPNYDLDPEYTNLLSRISDSVSVAVHVRRGDFKNDRNKLHYILDISYYKKAIEYMRSSTVSPVFYWFSDSIEWVKKNIGEYEDFRFIHMNTSHADIDEMMLMKNCNHIITANSTFSWWSAWLNEHEDAIRIVPERPYGNDYMIPEEWIKIPVE